MSDQSVIALGETAHRLLSDEAFTTAVLAVREDAIASWESAETVEKREQAHSRVSALGAILEQLHIQIQDSDLEKHKAEKDD